MSETADVEIGAPRGRASRERKQTQRLVLDEPKEKKGLEIKTGKGTKLADIPNVAFLVGKFNRKYDFLKKIHNLLYRKPGAYLVIKKNILAFSGFAYDEDKREAEMTKDASKLDAFKVDELNLLLDTFDLPRGKGEESKKEGKIKRILDFLTSPKVTSDKDLAALEEKKRLQRKRKAERNKKKKTGATKKSKTAKKAAAPKSRAAKPLVTSLAAEDDEDDDDDEGDASSSSEDESSDDEPLVYKTESKMFARLKEILKTSDLNVSTAKSIRRQLEAELDRDLSEFKPLIKLEIEKYLQGVSGV